MTEKQIRDLSLIPYLEETLDWSVDETGLVSIEYESEDPRASLAKLFRKNKKSHVTLRLDDLGSFIFTNIDGEKTGFELAAALSAEFGERAEPLYERFLEYTNSLWGKGFLDYRYNEPSPDLLAQAEDFVEGLPKETEEEAE